MAADTPVESRTVVVGTAERVWNVICTTPIADRLIPLEPLDLTRVKSIDDLVRAMSKTAFTGRQLGEAADVLEAMARDEDCFIVMTLSGAMTVAKQGLIITELIDRGNRQRGGFNRGTDGAWAGGGHGTRTLPA